MKYTPVPNDQYTDKMAKRDKRVINKAMRTKNKCSHCEGKVGSPLYDLCPKHQKAWVKARVKESMELEYGNNYKNIK